ncbi:MAG: hypothetical protein MUE68_02600 [Bacteroidetes bacterium]|nr:hypothetical protein [Bacteroidota bacterium]
MNGALVPLQIASRCVDANDKGQDNNGAHQAVAERHARRAIELLLRPTIADRLGLAVMTGDRAKPGRHRRKSILPPATPCTT